MYMIPYTRRSNSSMMDLFDELERSMFGESGRRTPVFSTDIRDEGAHYLLQADLPGFRKEDIDLDVKDGVLTISAKHQADDRTAADNYICRERRTGSFSRSFTLDGIQEDAIRAGDLEAVCAAAGNALEECSGAKDTGAIKALLREKGAVTALMTGSGSAVFGIFRDETSARAAAAAAKHRWKQVYTAQPDKGGARVV